MLIDCVYNNNTKKKKTQVLRQNIKSLKCLAVKALLRPSVRPLGRAGVGRPRLRSDVRSLAQNASDVGSCRRVKWHRRKKKRKKVKPAVKYNIIVRFHPGGKPRRETRKVRGSSRREKRLRIYSSYELSSAENDAKQSGRRLCGKTFRVYAPVITARSVSPPFPVSWFTIERSKPSRTPP